MSSLSTELISGIQREKEAGMLPSHVAHGMEELYHNYKDAVLFFPLSHYYYSFYLDSKVLVSSIYLVMFGPR